jgi:ATP synthase protein I
MSIMAPAQGFDADEPEEPEFKPLTAEQASVLRAGIPALSPWRVLGLQGAVGLLVALLAWGVSKQAVVAWSAGYGALAALVPSALFVRGLARQKTAPHPGAALIGFFVWEMVKIALTVAMLFAAPRLIVQLNWLALLAGFVVTMKVSWLAVWLDLVRNKSVKKDLKS